MCKDTLRIFCTIPWEKWSGKTVVWLLTTISVVAISWNCAVRGLLSREYHADCLIQTTWIPHKIVVMKSKMNQCAFLAGLRLQLSCFHRWKYCFYHQAPITRFKKHVFFQFQSCVDCLGHIVPFHEKRGQGKSVLWVLTVIPVVTLIWYFTKWYCQMTSKPEVASSLYLSENSNTWPNLMLYWRQKWTSVFFWQVWGCNDPYSKRKIELLQSGPKSQVQKNVFPCNFQAV